ncbi:MAG: alpha/beta hydrolase [Pseudobdellovibrionaceae bacterium]
MLTKSLTKKFTSCALSLLMTGLAAPVANAAAPAKPMIELGKSSVSNQGRHIIVTLHGVRGTATAYASFQQIIRDHLSMIDPGYQPITVNFTYQVGKEGFDPFSVANQLNSKIEQALAQSANPKLGFTNQISDQDKISVIAYSMGGQVGYAWLNETYKNPAKPEYKKYLERMDLFFSLGGTFWGTHFSQIGVDLSSILDSLGNDKLNLAPQLKIINFGGTSGSEIANLSDLSDVTQVLRAFRMEQARGLPGLKSRWVSLMGLAPCLFDADKKTPGCQVPTFDSAWDTVTSPLARLELEGNKDFVLKYLGGGIRLEADGPVPTTNANFNFLFAQDLNPNYSSTDVLSTFFGSQSGPVQTPLLEEIFHAADGRAVTDMVVITDKCKISKTCDNPVYRHLLNALANCQREKSSCLPGGQGFINQFYAQFAPMKTQETNLKNEMRVFSLDLNIRLPDGYQVPAELNKTYQNQNLNQAIAKIKNAGWLDKSGEAKQVLNYLMSNGDNRKLLNYVKFAFNQTPNGTGVFQNDTIKTDPSLPYVVQIARQSEALSVSFRYTEKDSTGHPALIASIKGVISPKDVKNVMDLGSEAYLKAKSLGTTVPFVIALPGLKPRTVKALVQPAYSTYVDVQMAK